HRLRSDAAGQRARQRGSCARRPQLQVRLGRRQIEWPSNDWSQCGAVGVQFRNASLTEKTRACFGEHSPANGSLPLFRRPGILSDLQPPKAMQAIDIFRSKVGSRLTKEGECGRAYEPDTLVGASVIALRVVAIAKKPKAAPITSGGPV